MTQGCSRETPPAFPNHLSGYLSAPANEGFSAYVEAAAMAEKAAPTLISRTDWTPDQKRAAITACAPAIEHIKNAGTDGVIAYVYSPHSPLAPPGEWRGWRFLGRVLVWQIEEAKAGGNLKSAIDSFIQLLRFGLNLAGGDALGANLGFSMIREGAETLWPTFPQQSPDNLQELHRRVLFAMNRAPTLQTTIRHERAAMLQAVQSIQDSFRAGDLKKFEDALRSDIVPATKYLEGLRRNGQAEQVKYFALFAFEAEREVEQLSARAEISPHLWGPFTDPAGERPWRRFAAHYFRSGRALLEDWAEMQAQLRLLAVDAAFLASLKLRKVAPASLGTLQEWVRTDPFSGRDFMYFSRGTDYSLYSLGEDRKDDSGDRARDLVPAR
jgi:hypothetical protein